MRYHAFMSYSHSDSNIMRRIHSDLEAAGLQVWTDESLVPGTHSWKNAIEEAIQASEALVVLLSPEAKHSDWIEKEMDYARACQVPIVPVVVRGSADITTVPFELINVQRIDIRPDYRAGIQQLINTLQQNTSIDAADASSVAATTHRPMVLEELHPASFYDHVRLFIWLFWQPQKLMAYRERYDDDALRQTAAWVASDLLWIAFLAPAIGIILGTVIIQTDADPLNVTALQAISGVIFLGGWFMTGALGWRNENRFGLILLVCTTLIIFGLFIAVETFSGVVLSQGTGLTRPFFLLVLGILVSTAAGIAFRLAPSAAGTVGGVLLGSLLFNAVAGVQLGVEGGVAAFVMFAHAILIGWVVDNSVKTGTRTPWHLVAFVITMGGGASTIILYFLGGWILLQGL